jgi:hypothetical protein
VHPLRHYFFSLASILLLSHFCTAAERPGLEVEDPTVVPVIVENVSQDAERRGITPERIEARVNAILRKNSLKPVDEGRTRDYFLYVQVDVVGPAFDINVFFIRGICYYVGDQTKFTQGRTWVHGTVGVSQSGKDYILDAVSEQTEVFVNAFLKANNK